MTNKLLMEFEKLNTTTKSIYDLEGLDVLIIIEDGTNLTSWDDVKDKNDVIYVSEDLSGCRELAGKYKFFTKLKAIVASNMNGNSCDEMFLDCKSLTDISSLSNWDTSNVKSMESMFDGCRCLTDLSSLEDWNTANVENMCGML